jgi:hypothetical protein
MNGERPKKFEPSGSSDTVGVALTKIITACWQAEPSLRPTFTNVVNDLSEIVVALTDVAKCGNSSSMVREAIQLESVTVADTKRPLTSLSIDEVVSLFKSLSLPDECEPIIRNQLIDGRSLSAVTSINDLKKLRLPLNNRKSRALCKTLNEIRGNDGCVSVSSGKFPSSLSSPLSSPMFTVAHTIIPLPSSQHQPPPLWHFNHRTPLSSSLVVSLLWEVSVLH